MLRAFGGGHGHGQISKAEQYNVTWTKLNPNKHIYMHHQFQKSHDDYYVLGEYPTPEILAQKIASKAYEIKAIDVSFKHLQTIIPGFSLTKKDFENVKNHSWQVYGVDIDAYKYQVLSKLAQEIVVKENKNRPKIE